MTNCQVLIAGLTRSYAVTFWQHPMLTPRRLGTHHTPRTLSQRTLHTTRRINSTQRNITLQNAINCTPPRDRHSDYHDARHDHDTRLDTSTRHTASPLATPPATPLDTFTRPDARHALGTPPAQRHKPRQPPLNLLCRTRAREKIKKNKKK